MGLGVPVIVKYKGEIFGRYRSIKEASKAVEDYFVAKGKKRPSVGHGFGQMINHGWTPDDRSQLYGWRVEKL